jgi:UDP-glucose 4-epimerase
LLRQRAATQITERSFVKQCMQGVDVVLHTATLHKHHVASHTRQHFVDTNITGTLNLLEGAASAGIRSSVFTSTTSGFGHALTPPTGAPAAP